MHGCSNQNLMDRRVLPGCTCGQSPHRRDLAVCSSRQSDAEAFVLNKNSPNIAVIATLRDMANGRIAG